MKDGEGFFISDRPRSNGYQVKKSRFMKDSRKKFFTMRIVKHWNTLPREILDAPSLEVFRVRQDGTPKHLISWKVSLLMKVDGIR